MRSTSRSGGGGMSELSLSTILPRGDGPLLEARITPVEVTSRRGL